MTSIPALCPCMTSIPALCPCKSNQLYTNCCHPHHTGVKPAHTAEKLMRSRFSAYALKQYGYIVSTYRAQSSQAPSIHDIQQNDTGTTWLNLSIIKTEELENNAVVEFVATYKSGSKYFNMHETSQFIKQDKQWYYTTGSIGSQTGQLRLGRNDICPCGSGKKVKKCC